MMIFVVDLVFVVVYGFPSHGCVWLSGAPSLPTIPFITSRKKVSIFFSSFKPNHYHVLKLCKGSLLGRLYRIHLKKYP